MNKTIYLVTRQFTNGSLKGLKHTFTTGVKFEVGKEYRTYPGHGNPRYVILSSEIQPLHLKKI